MALRGRSILPGDPFFAAIQTDAQGEPGGSGGPLANLDGSVVGVNTQTTQPATTATTFAITSSQASRVAAELIATGTVTRATLGATVATVSLLDGPGVRVTALVPSGPAAKAGLKVDDVIAQVGDVMISSSDGLSAAVSGAIPGQRLMVRFTRLNTAATTYVVLARTKG